MKISYSQLLFDIRSQKIESIILVNERREVYVYYKDGKQFKVPIFFNDQQIIRAAESSLTPLTVKDYKTEQALTNISISFGVIFIFFIGLIILLNYASKVLNNTLNLRTFDSNDDSNHSLKYRFDDVAGISEAREELEEIVQYLKNPEKLKLLGAKIPKGVLLCGPPGTGKTLLAKAIAGESEVPFFSIAASEFVELYVGVGARRIRNLFIKAKKESPSIIFIDEIDSIGRKRGTGIGIGNDEREQTLNQLLTELDGFDDNSGLIIIASTNRPDILDKALLRPGRFDRTIFINLPDFKERLSILSLHSRSYRLSEKVNLQLWANKTLGFSGADLKNLLNESAISAGTLCLDRIEERNIELAFDKITLGLNKANSLSYKSKLIVSYNIVGQAIVSMNLPNTDKIEKISILSMGFNKYGFVQFIKGENDQDNQLPTKSYLKNKIIIALAGRAAELILLGEKEITQCSKSDIEFATKLAREMVLKYGFSNLSLTSFDDNQNKTFLGKSLFTRKNKLAQLTASKVDKQVIQYLYSSIDIATSILNKYKLKLIEISRLLVSQETIHSDKLQEIMKGS